MGFDVLKMSLPEEFGIGPINNPAAVVKKAKRFGKKTKPHFQNNNTKKSRFLGIFYKLKTT